MTDRFEWLFPTASEVDGFDPDEDDDRAVLIRGEHPEYVKAIEAGQDVIEADTGTMSPRLHLALHEAVATQVWGDNPPEVWPTVMRLRAAGYDRHEILHMLAFVLGESFRRMQLEQVPMDAARYAVDLDELPESWQDVGEDDEDGYDDEYDDEYDNDADALLTAALAVLAEHGPLTVDELADYLDEDPDDIADVGSEPPIALLAGMRFASIPALLAGTILTHRLTEDEAAAESLLIGVDLAPALAFVCGGDHIHLAGGAVADLVDKAPPAAAPAAPGAAPAPAPAPAPDLMIKGPPDGCPTPRSAMSSGSS